MAPGLSVLTDLITGKDTLLNDPALKVCHSTNLVDPAFLRQKELASRLFGGRRTGRFRFGRWCCLDGAVGPAIEFIGRHDVAGGIRSEGVFAGRTLDRCPLWSQLFGLKEVLRGALWTDDSQQRCSLPVPRPPYLILRIRAWLRLPALRVLQPS